MINSEYEIQDDIYIFHKDVAELNEDYNALDLVLLHKYEKRHFWFLSRREWIYRILQKYIHKNDSILETGAGTGNTAAFLKSKGYKNIAVSDMHVSGLNYARQYGLEKLYQFDLMRTPFVDEFDVVLLFDVIEHIEDDARALLQAGKMLHDDGMVILTVPAHQWLWHEGDVHAGHKRRYNKKQLKSLLVESGFEPLYIRYFFISLVPFLLIRKIYSSWIQSEDNSSQHTHEKGSGLKINPVVNSVFRTVTRIDNMLLPVLPNICGGSIIAVGRKT